MEVPKTVKSIISILSKLVQVKELYVNAVTLGIEVNLKLSMKKFHRLVKEIEDLGFKLERITSGDNGYFDAVYKNYGTGESIRINYVPIDGVIIRSITYHKPGETIK